MTKRMLGFFLHTEQVCFYYEVPYSKLRAQEIHTEKNKAIVSINLKDLWYKLSHVKACSLSFFFSFYSFTVLSQ